jgi:hypothetical protein
MCKDDDVYVLHVTNRGGSTAHTDGANEPFYTVALPSAVVGRRCNVIVRQAQVSYPVLTITAQVASFDPTLVYSVSVISDLYADGSSTKSLDHRLERLYTADMSAAPSATNYDTLDNLYTISPCLSALGEPQYTCQLGSTLQFRRVWAYDDADDSPVPNGEAPYISFVLEFRFN